jgi:hypothetical protein
MSLPYVGSVIGLISQNDIRFQGTLQSINPNDSTVTLVDGNGLIVVFYEPSLLLQVLCK